MSTTEVAEVVPGNAGDRLTSAARVPALHVPDEPTGLQERWLTAVLDGQELSDALDGPGGLADWLWERWRVLATAGVDRPMLGSILLAYRREVWLWLAGERTWAQCCAGLVGRIGRRAGRRAW